MLINPLIKRDGAWNDIFSCNLEQRIIHLIGTIDDATAASVIGQLVHLDSLTHEPISIYINSPGGSVTAGMGILDTMNLIKSKVSTVCVGMAASMAAVIFSAGEKGRRYMLPHAEIMIHQPLGGMEGQASDILIAAEHIRDAREELAEVLSDNTGRTKETVLTDMERDNWMRAKAAVEYGIADHILSREVNHGEKE